MSATADGVYVVRRLSVPPSLLAGLVVALVAAVLLRPGFAPVFGVLAVAFVAFAVYRGSVVLRVDRRGVYLGRGLAARGGGVTVLGTLVRWEDIAGVEVAAPTVRVRLRAGAALPQGVRGVIREADGTVAPSPELEAVVDGLDRAALDAALAVYRV